MLSVAARFLPPPGYTPVKDRDEALRFAQSCQDDADFWARCERADWMLYAAAFTDLSERVLLASVLPWMRGMDALLEPDALLALGGLEAFLAGEPLLTLEHFEHGTGAAPITDACRHFLGAGVRQALTVARRSVEGPALGAAKPTVWSQLALYPARALRDGFSPDLDFLKRAADDLRARLPPL